MKSDSTLHPRETPADPHDPRVLAIARLVGIVDRLRGEPGCPWDKKQTVLSMAPSLIEESFEALEAIEHKSDAEVVEECGDLLMVIALIARIGEDQQRFDLQRIGQAVSDKLVRRHPHVFDGLSAKDADAVLANWEAIKKAERAAKGEDTSALAGVPAALPALQRAARVSSKAMSAGFAWANVAGAVAKLREEQAELEEALAASGLGQDAKAPATPEQRAAVEAELGDVLLAAAFLANYLKLDPERLCRSSLARFERRFRRMEQELPSPLQQHDLEQWMAAWARAKRHEG